MWISMPTFYYKYTGISQALQDLEAMGSVAQVLALVPLLKFSR